MLSRERWKEREVRYARVVNSPECVRMGGGGANKDHSRKVESPEEEK